MSTRALQSIHAWIFTGLVVVVALAALMRARTFDPPPIKEELIDGRVAHAFEAHYDEAFPIRNFGISVWAAIEYVLFREAKSGVVIGKEGWLFTDEEFIVPNRAQEDLARNLSLIAYVQRELAKKGVRLMMVIVPSKARVYPEHLGSRQPPPLHRDLLERVESGLLAHHVTSASLLPALQAAKTGEPVFLRTDTHWTPQGARIAAQATAAGARNLLPAPPTKVTFRTQPAETREHRGDLFNFLPLEPWFAFLLPAGEPLAVTATEKQGGAEDLLGDAKAPRIALVGTSYSAQPAWNFHGSLQEALQEDVGNYAKEGLGPYAPMFEYLRSQDFAAAPPRLVLWEIPERYLVTHQPLEQYHLPAEAFKVRARKTAARQVTASRAPDHSRRSMS